MITRADFRDSFGLMDDALRFHPMTPKIREALLWVLFDSPEAVAINSLRSTERTLEEPRTEKTFRMKIDLSVPKLNWEEQLEAISHEGMFLYCKLDRPGSCTYRFANMDKAQRIIMIQDLLRVVNL